jgi:membrane protein implicated in regulation of membrane protease activity
MKIVGVALIVISASLILLEMHTLTLYLLAAAAACLAGGAVALAGWGPVGAVSVMALTGAVALPLAHWSRGRLRNRASEDVTQDDIGHSVTVLEVDGTTLRVSYRGSTWSARLRDPAEGVPGPGSRLLISAREGSTLVLDAPHPRV